MNYGLLAAYLGLSFSVGAIPFISLLTVVVSGKKLSQLGTGNISVSAAFYHAGTLTGIIAVLIEASKGIGVVLLASHWFPNAVSSPLLGLICLVLGRFLIGKGAGTTNVVWGIIAYNWRIAFSIFLFSLVVFILQRDRNTAKYAVLFLLPLVVGSPNSTFKSIFHGHWLSLGIGMDLSQNSR